MNINKVNTPPCKVMKRTTVGLLYTGVFIKSLRCKFQMIVKPVIFTSLNVEKMSDER